MSAARKKGTAYESEIVRYLRENGVPHAERRALGGTNDRGDISGIPGIVIEAKSGAFNLAGWIDEAEQERLNDGADYGIVWAKRRGKATAGSGYAIMTGATLLGLLQAAGYIARSPAPLSEVYREALAGRPAADDTRAAASLPPLVADVRDLLSRIEAHLGAPPSAATGRVGGRAQDAAELAGEMCALCHAEPARPQQLRAGKLLCDGCAEAWDYRASLTPEQLRADDEAMARYVDESSARVERPIDLHWGVRA